MSTNFPHDLKYSDAFSEFWIEIIIIDHIYIYSLMTAGHRGGAMRWILAQLSNLRSPLSSITCNRKPGDCKKTAHAVCIPCSITHGVQLWLWCGTHTFKKISTSWWVHNEGLQGSLNENMRHVSQVEWPTCFLTLAYHLLKNANGNKRWSSSTKSLKVTSLPFKLTTTSPQVWGTRGWLVFIEAELWNIKCGQADQKQHAML